MKVRCLGNQVSRLMSHGFQETSILYWNSLDFFHPGSGEVIGSLPGSCRISWDAIWARNSCSKWTSEGTGWRRERASFFHIRGDFVPSAGSISRCLQQQMSEGTTCEISVAT